MLVVVMLGPLATVDTIIAAPALAHDYERLLQSSVPMPIDTHAPGRGRLGMAKTTTICQAERTAPLPALPPPPAPRPRRSSTRPSPARDPRVPRPLPAPAHAHTHTSPSPGGQERPRLDAARRSLLDAVPVLLALARSTLAVDPDLSEKLARRLAHVLDCAPRGSGHVQPVCYTHPGVASGYAQTQPRLAEKTEPTH